MIRMERNREREKGIRSWIGSREVGVIFLQFAEWDFSLGEGINLNSSALVLWIFFFFHSIVGENYKVLTLLRDA